MLLGHCTRGALCMAVGFFVSVCECGASACAFLHHGEAGRIRKARSDE